MAFECRREELARESAVEPGQVGDAAVVESYRQQIEPGGAMLDYLEAGDLAVVIGDVLFVHGGFRPETCGKCPPGAGSAETVADWVGALNAFKVLLLLLLLLPPLTTNSPPVQGSRAGGLPFAARARRRGV